jgi:hypothetical protein
LNAVEALRAHRWKRVDRERDLHDQIAEALAAGGVAFAREHRLGPSHRVDFVVPFESVIGTTPRQLAIEAKIDGPSSWIVRQLQGYAIFDEVAELVLVTTRQRHGALLPRELAGKPLTVVYAGGWGA